MVRVRWCLYILAVVFAFLRERRQRRQEDLLHFQVQRYQRFRTLLRGSSAVPLCLVAVIIIMTRLNTIIISGVKLYANVRFVVLNYIEIFFFAPASIGGGGLTRNRFFRFFRSASRLFHLSLPPNRSHSIYQRKHK